MSETLPTPDVDLRWVREHQVCWELSPMCELVKGHGMQQTGYALKVFGRFDAAAQDDDFALARRIYERLRALALDAVRSLPVQPLVQVQPFGRGVLPADSRFIVEVELMLVASPPHPDHPLPPAEVRRLIALLEQKLGSMGLKKRT